jgi:hypothetical protein
MKEKAVVTNEPVRSIIRDSNKDLDGEAAAKARSMRQMTQALNRKRAEKNEVIQFYDTPLYELFIPESLQRTYLNQVFGTIVDKAIQQESFYSQQKQI